MTGPSATVPGRGGPASRRDRRAEEEPGRIGRLHPETLLDQVVDRSDVLVLETLDGDIEVDGPGAVDDHREDARQRRDARWAQPEVGTAEVTG